MKHKYEIGMRYGRLTLVKVAYRKNHRNIWECLCDCGNTHYVMDCNLGRGCLSCGCLSRDKHKTHGESKTRLYQIWAGMKKRCYNPNEPAYKYYGGRGVIMCDEWENDYSSFSEWAKNNGYHDGLTIDRIDNDGCYEPSNCKWSTYREQQNNRSVWGSVRYHGIVKDNTGYRAQVTINGEKVYIAHSVDDIEFLVRKRNDYIDEHNLPNKKNVFIG